MKKSAPLFDVLVVGELNADLILHHPQSFPELEKEILAQDCTLTMGSSSAIFAAVISRLGLKVAFVGKLGKDLFGDLILDRLQHYHVDTRFIKRDKALKTGITVILNYGKERSMVTYPGAMQHLTLNDIPERALQSARHLHVSSFFLQKSLMPDFYRLFQKAKEMGLSTSLDPQWDPAENWNGSLKACLPYVDIFLPNQQEALWISGQQDLRRALQFFAESVALPIVKLGKEGALGYYKGEFFHLPSFKVSPVDAVGAGDSFDAGFVYGYLNGLSVQESVRLANACGALSTTAPGGTGAFEDAAAAWEKIHSLLASRHPSGNSRVENHLNTGFQRNG